MNLSGKKAQFLVLFLILILGFFLRVVNLDKVPNGFFCDEASIGYNAYSLLKSGRDEFGKSWPLFFRAFGEYKNPIQIYSTIPFVALFGLNEGSVRLVSAIYGTLTILAVYFLVKELLIIRRKTQNLTRNNAELQALLGAFGEAPIDEQGNVVFNNQTQDLTAEAKEALKQVDFTDLKSVGDFLTGPGAYADATVAANAASVYKDQDPTNEAYVAQYDTDGDGVITDNDVERIRSGQKRVRTNAAMNLQRTIEGGSAHKALQTASQEANLRPRIYAVPLAGGEPRILFHAAASEACFAPDGKSLAFVHGAMAWWRKNYRGSANFDIWVKTPLTAKANHTPLPDTGATPGSAFQTDQSAT